MPEKLVTPKTEPMKEPAAMKILRKKQASEAREKSEAIAADNAANIHYLKCPRFPVKTPQYPAHHAAYLTEFPVTRVTPSNWFSAFHDAGQPWKKPSIPCQECFLAGEGREWPVNGLKPVRLEDGSFEFTLAGDRQHIFGTISREEYEQKQAQIEAFKEKA